MNELDINKTRESLVSHYFYNLRKNRINPEILLISFQDKKFSKQFIEDDFIKNCEDLIITSLGKLTKKHLNNKKNTNIILIENKEILFGNLKIFQEENIEILFYRIFNFSEIRDYFELYNINFRKPEIRYDEQHYFYLKKQPLNNITDNVKYAKYFISTFLDYKSSNHLSFSTYTIKLFLLRNSNTITIDTILNDIQYFENIGVLTSRLGIFIYKICTFFHDATDKEIGLYYSKKLGKSKPYNNKRFNIKNTKGYLVNIKEQTEEYKIRSEIASYLLKHTNLDRNSISEATKLSIEELTIIKVGLYESN